MPDEGPCLSMLADPDLAVLADLANSVERNRGRHRRTQQRLAGLRITTARKAKDATARLDEQITARRVDCAPDTRWYHRQLFACVQIPQGQIGNPSDSQESIPREEARL